MYVIYVIPLVYRHYHFLHAAAAPPMGADVKAWRGRFVLYSSSLPSRVMGEIFMGRFQNFSSSHAAGTVRS
jgi:hypothetical protein